MFSSFFKKYDTSKPIKVALLGDSSTGKTCLFKRVCQYNDSNYKFNKKHVATEKFNLYKLTFSTNIGEVNVHLWDTAGQEDKEDLRNAYIYGAGAVMILYSVNKKQTIEHVQKWLTDTLETCGPIPVVVIGNKVDKFESQNLLDTVRFRDAKLKTMYGNNRNISNTLISVKANIAIEKQHLNEKTLPNGVLYPFQKLLSMHYGTQVQITGVL